MLARLDTHLHALAHRSLIHALAPARAHDSWAKSTIFINKPVSALLRDAGNIPVDRKNKDNQALFSGTFEVLKKNEAVAIFPEGTSYTEPGMLGIKEGASWVSQ
jgi:1-acyl-sn-glycerol-3-phosphate acyltransferase